MKLHIVLVDRFIDTGKAVERNDGVVSIGCGPGVDIHELGLLIANFVQPLRDIFVGNFGLAVVNGDAAILFQIDSRRHFEFGLEPERFTFLKLNVFDAGAPHHLQILFFHFLLEILGEQIFDDVVAHLFGKLGANEINGNFSGAESR